MSLITSALYDRLAGDAMLAGMLATYGGQPAVFTTDPVPGDATLPYVVSAGDVTSSPFDTKTEVGREIWRDVRCYAEADGSALAIEAIAERVYQLLHRQPLVVAGYGMFVAECSGPVVADEEDVYGRVITIRSILQEV